MGKKAKRARDTELLMQLTSVLNSLNEAGLAVKLKHGAVYTKIGYVLPIDDDRWVARTLVYTELEPVERDNDDYDD